MSEIAKALNHAGLVGWVVRGDDSYDNLDWNEAAAGQPKPSADEVADMVSAYQQYLVQKTLVDQAKAALDASDVTAARCFKAGVKFPQVWSDYCDSLREIITDGTGTLPTRPAYPAGT